VPRTYDPEFRRRVLQLVGPAGRCGWSPPSWDWPRRRCTGGRPRTSSTVGASRAPRPASAESWRLTAGSRSWRPSSPWSNKPPSCSRGCPRQRDDSYSLAMIAFFLATGFDLSRSHDSKEALRDTTVLPFGWRSLIERLQSEAPPATRLDLSDIRCALDGLELDALYDHLVSRLRPRRAKESC
jgi:hypothetical protein